MLPLDKTLWCAPVQQLHLPAFNMACTMTAKYMKLLALLHELCLR